MIYCCKCHIKTETNDTKLVTLKNNKPAETGTCANCGTKKFKLVKRVTGGDLVSAINSVTKHFKLPGQRYPGEMHYPGASFMGPGTRLDFMLNSDGTPKPDSMPINRVDEASYRHDLWKNSKRLNIVTTQIKSWYKKLTLLTTQLPKRE